MRDAHDDGYDVGYGKPPRGTQFKKGQSGNPKGRPKGAKSFKTLVDEVLNEKVTIVVNGKPRKVTKKKALARQAVHSALRDNDLKLLKAMGAFDEPMPALPQLAGEPNEDWEITLMFDNEPQITTRNGEVVMDHRIARWKDSDESDWLS